MRQQKHGNKGLLGKHMSEENWKPLPVTSSPICAFAELASCTFDNEVENKRLIAHLTLC